MTVEELTHKSGQRIKQQHPAGEGGQPGVTREDIKNCSDADFQTSGNFKCMLWDLSDESKLVSTFKVSLGHIAPCMLLQVECLKMYRVNSIVLPPQGVN